MQQYPLLQTKLHVPPIRRELVLRPRLIERLNAGLNRKLTLVSAPAGFGKTTLLSAWIDRHDGRGAWLSLDDGDDEATRFWTYLLAAQQAVHADLGHDTLHLLQAAQSVPVQAILSALLNEIAVLAQPRSASGIVLVLDDYHLISTSQIHEGIAFLLEHQPPNLHLVTSTRADPPLPVFRPRARGHLIELRTDDLRFTPGEASTFLNTAMGLELTPADVEALETRTEGWIVGLQLAALSLPGCTDASRFIAAQSIPWVLLDCQLSSQGMQTGRLVHYGVTRNPGMGQSIPCQPEPREGPALGGKVVSRSILALCALRLT